MIVTLLVMAAAAAPHPRPAVAPPPRSAAPHAVMDTRCDACHSASGWKQVTFDHSHTGFPLEGRHLGVSCAECHRSGDFRAAVATSCVACHQDVHTGEFGTRCGSCHDSRDWQPLFTADAHRGTNFPLIGRHAALACEECHLNQRDRKFTRTTVECVGCHQADYDRTFGTAVDHKKAGFGTNCRTCHFPSTFRSASFPAHEACFQIASGPHARIGCLDCHTSLGTISATGACATNTASCQRCHACGAVTPRHSNVTGFQCRDRKCYECHKFTASGIGRSRFRGRIR